MPRNAIVALALLALAVTARAGMPPGDFLVSEFQAGALVNVRAGGDLAAAPRFATGLAGPFGLCLGPGGDLYAAEFLSGEVTVVTAGGDFAGAPAFATGLTSPIALACSPSQVLVLEGSTGAILDVGAGGDFGAAAPFASVPPPASDLLRIADGRLLALSAAGLFDVTAGGSFAPGQAFAFGGSEPRVVAEHDGALLVADYAAGAILDATAGGDLAAAPAFAELLLPAGLIDLGGYGLYAVSDGLDAVYDATSGGDLATRTPDAQGVRAEYYAGTLFLSTCGDGALQVGEECDDGNTTPGDGCSERCEVQLCAIPPLASCHGAARARLVVKESRPGRERLRARLRRAGSGMSRADLGDPATGGTRVDLCVYDDADALVGELRVDRAGATCGRAGKPCWSARRGGYRYRDPENSADGVRRIRMRVRGGGTAALRFDGANDALHLRTSLPTGIASALQGSASVRVQAVTSDGACFDAELGDVKARGPDRLRAKRR